MASFYPMPPNLTPSSIDVYNTLTGYFEEKTRNEAIERIAQYIMLKEPQYLHNCHIDMKYLNEIILHSSCKFSFPDTDIRKSTIEGNGLFACVEIPKGTIFSFYPVDFIVDVSNNPEGKDFTGIIRTSSYLRNYVPENGIKAKIKKSILRHYSIHIPNIETLFKKDLYIIGGHPFLKKPFQNAHFINHSLNPNAYFYPVSNGLWIVISNRDIKENEEITVNYGEKWEYKNV